MQLYARFEAEEGSYREAAELYDRALRIDPLSPVMGVHNRADWASLEADLGNTGLARQLLEGGLEAHPRSAPLLVTLAKVSPLARYPVTRGEAEPPLRSADVREMVLDGRLVAQVP